jgi:hypothetical protein
VLFDESFRFRIRPAAIQAARATITPEFMGSDTDSSPFKPTDSVADVRAIHREDYDNFAFKC